MKRLLWLRSAILIVAIAASTPASQADVLPPAGEESNWAVLSLEGVASLERPLGSRKSLSLWGGVGTVWVSGDGEQSWGGEIATEVRAYVRGDDYCGPSAGAYLGIGLFDGDEEGQHIAVTPGVKVTFGIRTAVPAVLVEPYLGLSYPLIKELDGGEWGFPDTPFMTLGCRLAYRHLQSAFLTDCLLHRPIGPCASRYVRSASSPCLPGHASGLRHGKAGWPRSQALHTRPSLPLRPSTPLRTGYESR
jgi:hypothetical protein